MAIAASLTISRRLPTKADTTCSFDWLDIHGGHLFVIVLDAHVCPTTSTARAAPASEVKFWSLFVIPGTASSRDPYQTSRNTRVHVMRSSVGINKSL